MHTGGTWRLGHRPALDGLRGVAILLVVASHAFDRFHAGAAAGVTLFFALSGFLITSLLLEERTHTGRIRFGAFYLRRARRLMPALAAMLAGVAVLAQLNVIEVGRGEWVASALYVENWRRLIDGPGTVLGHTWSLGIEEQFYLIWPALLVVAVWVFRRASRWVGVAALTTAVTASLAWSLVLFDPANRDTWARVYFGLDTRAASLGVGCLLAAILVGRRERHIRRGLRNGVAGVAVATLAACSFVAYGAGKWIGMPLLATLVAVPLLLIAAHGSGGWLTWPWLRLIGQRSYALYLWQPVMFAAVEPRVNGPVGVILALGVSWTIALASWRWVEQPIQQLGRSREQQPVEHPLTRPNVRDQHVVDLARERRRRKAAH